MGHTTARIVFFCTEFDAIFISAIYSIISRAGVCFYGPIRHVGPQILPSISLELYTHFPMLQLRKEDIPQFFDWLKSVLALSSAGVGSIAFSAKPGTPIPLDFKWATAFFLLAILLTLVSMIFVMEHKRSKNDFLLKRTTGIVLLSFVAFLAGMGAVMKYVWS